MLKNDSFDIAIVDVNMPEISGKEFFLICRKEYPEMQIILMTGMPDLADAVNTVKEGAYYYLPKPVNMNFLHSLLTSAAKEKENRREKASGSDIVKIKNLASDYSIVRSLGSGESGVVLLVEKDKRQYAMKILRWSKEEDRFSERLKRFIREAEILRQIKNEHVVRIYEHNLELQDANPYIIMEYVEGRSLFDVMVKDDLTMDQKISVILQIAEGLECVHRQGVLHRDIKPQNILITGDMSVKISDFGICHVADSSLTMTNELLGSPAYMAPENFEPGMKIDARADIFSLGVIGYELLTGERPFKGGTIFQIIEKIKHRKPEAPMKLNPQIPEWMQELLARMLIKKPENRLGNAHEVIKSINHYRSGGEKERASLTSRILNGMLFKNNVWK